MNIVRINLTQNKNDWSRGRHMKMAKAGAAKMKIIVDDTLDNISVPW